MGAEGGGNSIAHASAAQNKGNLSFVAIPGTAGDGVEVGAVDKDS